MGANKNIVRAAQEFNLETISFEDGDELMGVWDGSKFLVTVRITIIRGVFPLTYF